MKFTSFSKRIFLCALMTTDLVEFQTNECVSGHTFRRSTPLSVDDGVELRNV